MMTTTETVAAFIATRAPEPRYHSPFSLAFLASERELGERLGYPALVYEGKKEARGMPKLNIGICACGEWEGAPQTHTKCPNCGRTWLTLDEIVKQLKTINALYSACDEAHVTLFHYDLVRQPNGVDWEPVKEMRAKLVEQLWEAILLVWPELRQKA